MKIRILGPVNHNGSNLEIYEKYEINDAQAQALIDAGVAELVVNGEAKVEPESTEREEVDPETPYVGEAEPSATLKPEDVDEKEVVEPTVEADVPQVLTETPPADETPDDDNKEDASSEPQS